MTTAFLNTGFAVADVYIIPRRSFGGTLCALLVFFVRMGNFVFNFVIVVAVSASGVISIAWNSERVIGNNALSDIYTMRLTVFRPGVALDCIEVFTVGVVNNTYMIIAFEKQVAG